MGQEELGGRGAGVGSPVGGGALLPRRPSTPSRSALAMLSLLLLLLSLLLSLLLLLLLLLLLQLFLVSLLMRHTSHSVQKECKHVCGWSWELSSSSSPCLLVFGVMRRFLEELLAEAVPASVAPSTAGLAPAPSATLASASACTPTPVPAPGTGQAAGTTPRCEVYAVCEELGLSCIVLVVPMLWARVLSWWWVEDSGADACASTSGEAGLGAKHGLAQ